MFTGLIEGLGQVVKKISKGPDAELIIRPPWPIEEVVIGESVATNGVCLTVTKVLQNACCLDVSAESLSRTTLGTLKPNDLVNQERALQLSDRLGGHLVQGHVDCVGVINSISKLGSSTKISISVAPEHLKFVVEKGSIAVNGISLTVNSVDDSGFDLNIIPHSLEATSLKLVSEGDSVNIETDLIGKYVARFLNLKDDDKKQQKSLSLEDLARMGF